MKNIMAKNETVCGRWISYVFCFSASELYGFVFSESPREEIENGKVFLGKWAGVFF